MRRTGIAAAALALTAAAALTGCESREAFGKEPETSAGQDEEETQESWERGDAPQEEQTGEEREEGEDAAQPERTSEGYECALTTYWTVSVDDYTVSLQDEVPDASLKLVLHRGTVEKVIDVYEKKQDYNSPEEFTAETFENLLGHNGFCIYEDFEGFGCLTNYYAIEEDCTLLPLAASWTLPDGRAEGPSDYMVDLDGDGDRELICNVMYLADGACRTLIYRYDNGLVWQGFGDELREEGLDEDMAVMVNCIGSEYLPEEKAIRIWYPAKDGSGGFDKEIHAVDLDRLEMTPYEYTRWR